MFRFGRLRKVEGRSGLGRRVGKRIPVRVYTRDTLERGAAALTARWHCSKVTGTFEHRLLLRAPARYALWRRAPLQGPPPRPPR